MARRRSPRGLAVLGLAVVGTVGCKDRPSRLDHLADATITVDGELREPAWNLRAVRGVFTTDGHEARPWSEVRVLHDDTRLFVALYAADEDIRSEDAFDLVIGPRHEHLAAGGVPAFAALDVDGTIDQPTDDDEQWVVELAVPRAGLPDPLPLQARRCDTPKDGHARCSGWTGSVTLGR